MAILQNTRYCERSGAAEHAAAMKKKGHYLGTEIGGKWWRMYRGEGFFVRGNGEWWFDEEWFYFRRYLTKQPLKVPRDRIISIKTGNWHAGKWVGGMRILKIMWQHKNLRLSSGFVVSKNRIETMQIAEKLLKR
jgi:hypothetical protein